MIWTAICARWTPPRLQAFHRGAGSPEMVLIIGVAYNGRPTRRRAFWVRARAAGCGTGNGENNRAP